MRRTAIRRSPDAMCSDDAFLGTASAIGRRIVDAAIWDRGRCSWMGAAADPNKPWRLEYRALGPSAYDGTGGVGLFLAQLAAVTGEQSARRAALGAFRHALERANSLPSAGRDGLHAGVAGVALATARAATWMGEPELDARARALVSQSELPFGPNRCPDVVTGSAGSIIGLLALAEALDDRYLVERAVAAGAELLEHATVTPRGWSWPSPGYRYPRDLCGLSHGAGGIGWALVELFAATGDERFRAGATGAFAYERSWLDAESGRWPDLRPADQRRADWPRAGSSMTGTWCHGEAGIALTRLRAVAVLGSAAEARDAQIALETTRRHVTGLLGREIDDLSLCHGAAGSADVLITGGDQPPEVVALAHHALDGRDGGGEPWPCAVPGGTTPGLLLGLSGIGWWFLRLHDDRIPSPLGTWG
jgi:lantibiotic modifying enzyme